MGSLHLQRQQTSVDFQKSIRRQVVDCCKEQVAAELDQIQQGSTYVLGILGMSVISTICCSTGAVE